MMPIVVYLVLLQFAGFASCLQFTSQPSDHVTVAGYSVSFQCSAVGTSPTYQWYHDDQVVSPGNDYVLFSNGTLYVAAVNDSVHPGVYKCVAKESTGASITSRVAKLQLAYINGFSVQPQSEHGLVGQDATPLSCRISGSLPDATYQWLKDGNIVTRGSMSMSGLTSVLTLTGLKFSDTGGYSCKATNPLSGEIKVSSVAQLNVVGKPQIVQVPSSQSEPVGKSAIFVCQAEGNPPPTIKWKDPSNQWIISGGRFTLDQNGTRLVISDLRRSDIGFYTCQASNHYGETHAMSRLDVLDPYVAPQFTTHPDNRTLVEGNDIVLHCAASGNPAPDITWSKVGGVIPSNRTEEPAPDSLKINDANTGDSGVYLCTATNLEGVINASAYILVQGFPFITRGPSDTSAIENTTAEFECIVGGDPFPVVSWKTPDGSIYFSTSPSTNGITVLANGTLIISMVTKDSAGTYTCKASNGAGSKEVAAHLSVFTYPRIQNTVSYITRVTGQSLSVNCEITGNPVPVVQWSFKGSVLTTISILNIPLVNTTDQGQYTCRANNSVGETTFGFYLKIQVPPYFTSKPSNLLAPIGEDASLTCRADGDPMPVITWWKGEQQLVNSSNYIIFPDGTLVLKTLSSVHEGTFKCQASSSVGTVETDFTVSAIYKPTFTVVPVSSAATVNSAVNLTCSAGPFINGLVIRWYKLSNDGTTLINITSQGVVGVDGVNSYLSIGNVQIQDAGSYVCVAKNLAGSVQAQAYLNVLYKPYYNTPPPNITILAGKTAVLVCSPSSNPAATIKWMRPSGEMMSNTGSILTLSNVQVEQAGSYRCTATNTVGSIEAFVQLTVESVPSITDITKTTSGGNAYISCATTGLPVAEISWFHNNKKLPDSTKPQYYITNQNQLRLSQSELESNTFICNASNKHGWDIRLIKVPDPPKELTISEVTKSSLSLSWKPSNPSGIIISYYIVDYITNGSQWKVLNSSVTMTTLKVVDLPAYTWYMFKVIAVNGLGPSLASSPSENVSTLQDAPTAPRGLSAITFNSSSIRVTWSIPAVLNGPSSNLKYELLYGVSDNQVAPLVVESPEYSVEKYIWGLEPITRYVIKVRAGREGNDGVDMWSESVQTSETTSQKLPMSSPEDLLMTADGTKQIQITWKAPVDSISGYSLWYRKYNSDEDYIKINITTLSDTTYLIQGLEPDTRYEIKMRMYSEVGNGPFSTAKVIPTDKDTLGGSAARTSTVTESVFFKVGIAVGVILLLLVLILIAFSCYQRRQLKNQANNSAISDMSTPSRALLGHSFDDERRFMVASDTASCVSGTIGQYNFDHTDSVSAADSLPGRQRNYFEPKHIVFGTRPAEQVPKSTNQSHLNNEDIRLSSFQYTNPVETRNTENPIYTAVDMSRKRKNRPTVLPEVNDTASEISYEGRVFDERVSDEERVSGEERVSDEEKAFDEERVSGEGSDNEASKLKAKLLEEEEELND